jgi:hypothetical protein
MPARVCIGLILLLFFAVTWNLQLLTSNLRRHWPLLFEYWGRGPQYVDEVTAYERRFDSIRDQVAAYSTVGYRLIVPSDATDSARGGSHIWRHFIANYTLTPTVLDASANKHPVTVVDRCSGPIRLRRRR